MDIVSICFLFFSWTILFYPSVVVESFAGYRILAWPLCYLKVCSTSVKVFIVSTEKSGVILTGMTLYVTWSYSLAGLFVLY